MCGRFYVPDTDLPEELLALLSEAERRRLAVEPGFRLKRGELAPGDTVAVVAPGRAAPSGAFPMRWGFRLEGKGLKLLSDAAEVFQPADHAVDVPVDALHVGKLPVRDVFRVRGGPAVKEEPSVTRPGNKIRGRSAQFGQCLNVFDAPVFRDLSCLRHG